MKRITVLVALLIAASLSVSAQGLYFDAGIGVGGAWTKLDGNDASNAFDGNVREISVGFGLKAGYGPIVNLPFYITGNVESIVHRFIDGSYHIDFISYLIGPGIIYYPIPLIQLAGSIGFSFISNQTNVPGVILFENDGPGFAGDISVAFDFGKGNHGFLLGLKYFGAVNTLEISNVKQNSSALTVFGRYAFRHKIRSR